MLASRLLSAAILISTVLVFVFADAYSWLGASPGTFLLPVYVFLVCGTAYEFARLVSSQHEVSVKWIVAACLMACCLASMPILYPLVSGKPYPKDCPIGMVGWSAIAICSAIVVLALESLKFYGTYQRSVVVRFAVAAMIVAYCIGLSHFLIVIRLSPADYSGLILMVGVVIVTKMSDAGAYFTGRTIGKRPLHAIISPKKTWEGAIGGVVVAAVVAFIYFPHASVGIFGSPAAAAVKVPLWGPIVTGAGIAVFGLVGDLLESVFKRSVQAKDSSRLLPGLGGVWDVTDSLFFAVPFAYLAVLAGWIV